jgi:hypothetical protein
MKRRIKNSRKIIKWRSRKTSSEIKEREGEKKRNG